MFLNFQELLAGGDCGAGAGRATLDLTATIFALAPNLDSIWTGHQTQRTYFSKTSQSITITGQFERFSVLYC